MPAPSPTSPLSAEAATERIVHGPLASGIARFGTPLALGMALQTTFNFVDAYLVAQLRHDEVGPALGGARHLR